MGSYLTLSPNETVLRKIVNAVIGIMDGKTNNTGSFTVTANQATTVVVDFRCGADSKVTPLATTAAAATELASGSMYVSSVGKQTFTVSHVNSATAGRDFDYVIVG